MAKKKLLGLISVSILAIILINVGSWQVFHLINDNISSGLQKIGITNTNLQGLVIIGLIVLVLIFVLGYGVSKALRKLLS